MRITRVGLLALLLLALAACGSSSAEDGVASAGGVSASASASKSPGATDPDQARKFAQCMRENGVPDFPDPDPDGQFTGLAGSLDRNSGDFQKAITACQSLATNGGAPPSFDAQQQEQLRQFAQCMRDNGVDVADPDPNGGFGSGMTNLNMSDPKVQQAIEACQKKLNLNFGRGGN